MNSSVPKVTHEQLEVSIRKILPNASIRIQEINPDYGSYRLRVKTDRLDIEFIWGPISGFGATDYTKEIKNGPIDFSYADQSFDTLNEGLEYLTRVNENLT